MQKALVIGGLLEMAGAFEEEQQRIREEANRKRAEAASGHEFRGNQHVETNEVVEPQIEARLPEQAPKPKPKPSKPENKTTTAKAKTIGTSRANVERAEAINAVCVGTTTVPDSAQRKSINSGPSSARVTISG